MSFKIALIFFALYIGVYSESLTIEKVFLPPKNADNIYRYIPFNVPENIKEIRVEYQYDKEMHTVDIGIFDSNGLGKEGFRGCD